MKIRQLTIVLLLCIPAFVQAQKKIVNDPNAEERKVESFNGIRVSNAITLYLSQDDKETMAVSAVNEEHRSRIITTVEDGILNISYDAKNKFRNTGNLQLKVYLSFRDISSLKASGSSDVIVSGTVKVNSLKLDLSGSSDFRGNIEVKELNADLSGSSDAIVSGKSVSVHIEASGASDFKGYDLETDNCSAQASGASDIKITVNKELSARASGASDVQYKGAGVTKEVKTSGSASVSKKS